MDSIERRVEELEHKLADLTTQLADVKARQKDWRRTFGLSRDDDGFKEMMSLGREYPARLKASGQRCWFLRLKRRLDFYADWTVLPWDAPSAELFSDLRRQGIRIGSMDLKIACIALAHGATLLTRNSSDLAQVPGLRIENWLD